MNKKILWILPVCLCMFCACAKEEQVRQEPANGKETTETEYSADGGDLLEEEKYILYVESMDDMRIDAEPPEGFYVTSTGGPQNFYRIDEDGILWGSGENQYGQLG